MTDIPILFSGAMVRALLEGRKTQTRRVLSRVRTFAMPGSRAVTLRGENLKRALLEAADFRHIEGTAWAWTAKAFDHQAPAFRTHWHAHIPYALGDRLYVRETCWIWGRWFKNGLTKKTRRQKWRFVADKPHTVVLDPKHPQIAQASTPRERRAYWRRNAIHMPRWASRLTLVVTATKIEPLNKISHDDAVAEGCYRIEPCAEYPNGNAWGRAGFAVLWDRLHGKGSFDARPSPEVVALTFIVHRGNIDTLPNEVAA